MYMEGSILYNDCMDKVTAVAVVKHSYMLDYFHTLVIYRIAIGYSIMSGVMSEISQILPALNQRWELFNCSTTSRVFVVGDFCYFISR